MKELKHDMNLSRFEKEHGLLGWHDSMCTHKQHGCGSSLPVWVLPKWEHSWYYLWPGLLSGKCSVCAEGSVCMCARACALEHMNIHKRTCIHTHTYNRFMCSHSYSDTGPLRAQMCPLALTNIHHHPHTNTEGSSWKITHLAIHTFVTSTDITLGSQTHDSQPQSHMMRFVLLLTSWGGTCECGYPRRPEEGTR